jgi:hypothetical protein
MWYRLLDNVKEQCKARQATDDNTRTRFECWIIKTTTHFQNVQQIQIS